MRTLSNLSPFVTSSILDSRALRRVLIVLVTIVLLESMAASGSRAEDGPSFDCKKASTAEEKTICANDDLASLDRMVSDGYQRLVSNLGVEGANKINSPFFLARKKCNSNVECIRSNGLAEVSTIHEMVPEFPTKEQQSSLGWIAYSSLKTHIKVGDCVNTAISELGPRLCSGDCTGNLPFNDTGDTIIAENGIYGVSYDRIPGLEASKVGDGVKICLKSIPKGCPANDDRDYNWVWKDLRTAKTFELFDSEHMCGGA